MVCYCSAVRLGLGLVLVMWVDDDVMVQRVVCHHLLWSGVVMVGWVLSSGWCQGVLVLQLVVVGGRCVCW